jgi:hypothetical protein
MRDSDSKMIENYDFLVDSEASTSFARLDYELRGGVHIQYQYREQEVLFQFIDKHVSSLRRYYKDLFGFLLMQGGEGDKRYYFLDSTIEAGNKLSSELRQPLKSEFVIIGIFLCKMHYVDISEIETITAFKNSLREEYEPYKQDFYRLFAYAKGDNYTNQDDEVVFRQIDRAFGEFERLGWVRLTGDGGFEVMPSLERLRRLYMNEISNIEDLIKVGAE